MTAISEISVFAKIYVKGEDMIRCFLQLLHFISYDQFIISEKRNEILQKITGNAISTNPHFVGVSSVKSRSS